MWSGEGNHSLRCAPAFCVRQIKSPEEIARLPSMHDRPAALSSDEEVGKSEAMKLLATGPNRPQAAAAAAPGAGQKGGEAGTLKRAAAEAPQKGDDRGDRGIEGLNVGFGDDVGWGI